MTEFDEQSSIMGAAVLGETARLLRGLHVGPGSAAAGEGDEVMILVAPTWREDGSFTLAFTCRPRGHQLVDWGQLHIRVREDKGYYHVHLNERGQGRLDSCPPGDYVIWALSNQEAESFRMAGGPMSGAKPWEGKPWNAADKTAETPRPEVRLLRSEDNRVEVKMVTDDQTYQLVFRTREPGLAGATIHLWARAAGGESPEPIAEITLQAEDEQMWSGSCQGARPDREQEFTFTVTPIPSAPRDQP